jgi:anti-sigma factor RsiW
MIGHCGRARRVLWPDAAPRQATPDVLEALAHLDQCETCRSFFREMKALARVVRSSAPRPEAPPAVRERLFRHLARTRARQASLVTWTRAPLAAAAGVILAATLWWGWRARAGDADPIAAFAADHDRAPVAARIASAEPAAVQSWLEARLPFTIHVPVLPDTRLNGGRLCLMHGEQGAVLELEHAGHAVSYYVVPMKESADQGWGEALRQGSHGGYRVVAWQEGDLMHALVSDLPQPALTALARLCVEQGRGSPGARAGSATWPGPTAPPG